MSPQTDVMACAEKRRRDPIQNQEAAHLSWAKTVDRETRTAPGRRAFEQRFLDMADGDPVRAESYRKAHFRRMVRNSLATRARKAAARREKQST